MFYMAGNGMRYVLVRILDLQDIVESVAFNVAAHDINTELLQIYTHLQDFDELGSDLPNKFQSMTMLSELMSNSEQFRTILKATSLLRKASFSTHSNRN